MSSHELCPCGCGELGDECGSWLRRTLDATPQHRDDECIFAGCAEFLKFHAMKLGAEVNVGRIPPMFNHEDVGAFTCPHGVDWYVEPTNEQMMIWNRDGLP